MPITEDGVRAEICLNPLGVIGRLNMREIGLLKSREFGGSLLSR